MNSLKKQIGEAVRRRVEFARTHPKEARKQLDGITYDARSFCHRIKVGEGMAVQAYVEGGR